MDLTRKKGVKFGFRVVDHNRELFWTIIFLIVVLVVMCIYVGQQNKKNDECQIDGDCIASVCCHPDSCVHKSQAPDCSGIVCTAHCEPNTLDCGYGECKCINNKCTADII